MMPIGRQCASGLSLLLPAMRVLSSSAPYGVSGSPPLMFWATSRKPATGGPLGGGAGAPCRPPPPPRHTPDRSGFPSAVFGTGPFMSGSPPAVLGTPGVGCLGHCADRVGTVANAVTNATAKAALRMRSSGRIMLKILRSAHEPSMLRHGGRYRVARRRDRLAGTPLVCGGVRPRSDDHGHGRGPETRVDEPARADL